MYKRNNLAPIISLIMAVAFLLSITVIYAASSGNKDGGVIVSARSAALYQPEIKKVLYSKNAYERMPMASTTKIMTGLVALENCELSDKIKVDSSAVGIEGSSAYLKAGEVVSAEELIYALLLQSANDAAVALACYIGDDNEGFVDMMNERAKEIGANDTHFTNPHGLDNDEHYTTAHDLALITAEALKNDSFKQIVSTYKKSFSNGERTRIYVNHNKMLKRYEGCIGVKTGFTRKSGRCLVSAAERDGLTFVAVTLDAPDDWNDHTTLFDFGYDRLEKITFAKDGEFAYRIPVIDGKKDSIVASNPNGANIIVDKGEHLVDMHLKLVKFAVAPINQGDILGEAIYTLDGEEAARVNIVATEMVAKKEKHGFFDKLLSFFK